LKTTENHSKIIMKMTQKYFLKTFDNQNIFVIFAPFSKLMKMI